LPDANTNSLKRKVMRPRFLLVGDYVTAVRLRAHTRVSTLYCLTQIESTVAVALAVLLCVWSRWPLD